MKPASRLYNNLNSDYELTLGSDTAISPCADDGSIQEMHYAFKTIADIESTESNAVLDVLGIVLSVGPSQSIMRKNGAETVKRVVMIGDHTGRQMELTMWGDLCTSTGNELQVWLVLCCMCFCCSLQVWY